LGLIFVVFGLNAFLQFLPNPAPPTGDAGTFLTGILAAKYFFPFLKITEILGGLTLLTGFFAPLGLIILAPITLNIVAFHLFLDPANLLLPIVMLGLHLVAAHAYRDLYLPLLKVR
jgi:uncharacterized membrane protein YphA (DoxX/SURF4 family)